MVRVQEALEQLTDSSEEVISSPHAMHLMVAAAEEDDGLSLLLGAFVCKDCSEVLLMEPLASTDDELFELVAKECLPLSDF